MLETSDIIVYQRQKQQTENSRIDHVENDNDNDNDNDDDNDNHNDNDNDNTYRLRWEQCVTKLNS